MFWSAGYLRPGLGPLRFANALKVSFRVVVRGRVNVDAEGCVVATEMELESAPLVVSIPNSVWTSAGSSWLRMCWAVARRWFIVVVRKERRQSRYNWQGEHCVLTRDDAPLRRSSVRNGREVPQVLGVEVTCAEAGGKTVEASGNESARKEGEIVRGPKS